MYDELLNLLAAELGEIRLCEEECPGVYYLYALPENGCGKEYYLVLADAPISQDARALGRPLKTFSALIYLFDSEDGGRSAVQYEVLKYKITHDLPMPEGVSLRDIALYGMELCPDYFGTYPVPPQTPWGYTLRYRPLDNGIYWLETDQCVYVLSVCYPVWSSELPDGLLNIAGKLDHEDEMGNLFFREDSACIAIWELMRTRSELASLGLIRRVELMNAIWEYHPEYAMGYNAQEQAGLNEISKLLYVLGLENRELKSPAEHMMVITPGAGTNYIGFWI